MKNDKGEGKYMKPNPFKNKCQNKCSKIFTEIKRIQIFQEFWSLEGRNRKRDFLLNSVTECNVKKKHVIGNIRRK